MSVLNFVHNNALKLQGFSVDTMIVLEEAAREVALLNPSAKFAFDQKLVHHIGELQTDKVSVVVFHFLIVKEDKEVFKRTSTLTCVKMRNFL